MDSGDECVQRIVLAALGPEPVREVEEVFLVDRVQHRACRLLDDLAFECGDVGCIMHLVQFGFGDGEARRGDLATQSRRL